MRQKVLVGVAVLAALATLGAGGAQAGGRLSVRLLSNRADLISGGEALVSVVLPPGTSPGSVKVTAGGRDVTSAFAVRPNQTYEGLVTGLALGTNVLKVEAPGALSGQITIVNHAIGGPAFSGPQLHPSPRKNGTPPHPPRPAPTTHPSPPH